MPPSKQAASGADAVSFQDLIGQKWPVGDLIAG